MISPGGIKALNLIKQGVAPDVAMSQAANYNIELATRRNLMTSSLGAPSTQVSATQPISSAAIPDGQSLSTLFPGKSPYAKANPNTPSLTRMPVFGSAIDNASEVNKVLKTIPNANKIPAIPRTNYFDQKVINKAITFSNLPKITERFTEKVTTQTEEEKKKLRDYFNTPKPITEKPIEMGISDELQMMLNRSLLNGTPIAAAAKFLDDNQLKSFKTTADFLEGKSIMLEDQQRVKPGVRAIRPTIIPQDKGVSPEDLVYKKSIKPIMLPQATPYYKTNYSEFEKVTADFIDDENNKTLPQIQQNYSKIKDVIKRESQKAALDPYRGQITMDEDQSVLNAGVIGRYNEFERGITSSYEKRYLFKKAEIEYNRILEFTKNSPTPDKDVESLIKEAFNKALGFAAIGKKSSDILKEIHPDLYINRPLTDEDKEKGGPKYGYTLGIGFLDAFEKGQIKELGVLDRNDPFIDNTFRNKLLYLKTMMDNGMQRANYNHQLELFKKKESIYNEAAKKQLTKEESDVINRTFSQIDKEIKASDKFGSSLLKVQGKENLLKNQELKFVAGTYIEDIFEQQKESEAYTKAGGGIQFNPSIYLPGVGMLMHDYKSKARRDVFVRTSQYLGKGALDLGLNLVAFGANVVGLGTRYSRIQRVVDEATTPIELHDFNKLDKFGNPVSDNQAFWKDKYGKTHYQFSGSLYQGAQMTPLIVATVFGGQGIASLGGRAFSGVTKLSSRFSSAGRTLISSRASSAFATTFAETGSYATALTRTMASSANPIIKAAAYRAPAMLAMGPMVYSQSFIHAYNDMYEKGIEDAREKAHAIAAVSTAIEIATENIFPDMKFLDDFAQKGVTFGGKWKGTPTQWETLYSSVYGNVFSNRTLQYLAANSYKRINQGLAGARFMIARGVEEGIEEVSAELMDYAAQNAGLAAMQGEKPRELTLEDLLTAATGAFFGPPIGIGKQIKNYSKERNNRMLFDIAVNGEYYQNKVLEAQKLGEITNENAAKVLGKINEVQTKIDNYRVNNLRRGSSAQQMKTVESLFADPELQYDYFKKIIQKEELDKKLLDIDNKQYTEEEKKKLFDEAAENTKAINEYKRRASLYENLTEEDKDQIYANTVQNKKRLSQFATTESLSKSILDATEIIAKAQATNKPENYINHLRDYRDELLNIREAREAAKLDAQDTNTYNPIIKSLNTEGKAGPITESPKSKEDAINTITQVLLNPETRADVSSTLSGEFNIELEKIENDSNELINNYIESLNNNAVAALPSSTIIDEEGNLVESTTEGREKPAKKYNSIEDLNDSQISELEELLDELERKRDILTNRVNNIDSSISQYIKNGVDAGTITAEDAKTIIEEVGKLNSAVTSAYIAGELDSQTIFDSPERLAEYILENQAVVDKRKKEFDAAVEKAIEEQRKQKEAELGKEAAAESQRGDVVSTEKTDEATTSEVANPSTEVTATTSEVVVTTTPDGQVQVEPPIIQVSSDNTVTLTVPELIPTDVTPELTEVLTALESVPTTVIISDENNITGEISTEEVDNPEYTKLIEAGLQQVAKAKTLKGAQAIMAAMMTSINKSSLKYTDAEIGETLVQMGRMARNQPMFEEDYTHLFDLLRLTTNFEQDFKGIEDRQSAEELGISENQIARKAQVEARIVELNNIINNSLASIADNDNVSEIQNAWKTITAAKAELEQLGKELPELANMISEKIESLPSQTKKTNQLPAVSEEEQVKIEENKGVARTSPLFKRQTDASHFNVQQKIIDSLQKEFRDTPVALVDMFTVIEEVLGEETLTRLVDIFDEVTADQKPSPERLAQLRESFIGLFPEGFMKKSAIEYIFDKQMQDGISVTDIDAVNKPKLNPTPAEIYEVNQGRKVTITKPDGTVYRDVKVATFRDGKIITLIEGATTNKWVVIDFATDKVTGLNQPMEGTRKITINDINALIFTSIGKDGKVQKYNKDGQKTSDGNFGLFLYLPKANAQANELRKSIALGNKVKKETKLASKPVPTLTVKADGVSEVTGYELEYSLGNFTPVINTPTAVDQDKNNELPSSISTNSRPKAISQADTVEKLDKVIADSKNISEPDKEGYNVKGKKFERQSNFVRRINGEPKVKSNINMERGAGVGNLLDIIGRDVLGGVTVKSKEEYVSEAEKMALNSKLNDGKGFKLNITQEAFDNIVAELTELKNELEGKGWVLRTQNLVVYREYTEAEKKASGYDGVAGAMDIVAVDPEGKMHIIDLKNKVFNSKEKFTTELFSGTERVKSAVSKWATQQTVYGLLSEDFGLSVGSINAFAFASEYVPGEAENSIDILGLTMAKNKTEVPAARRSQFSDKIIRLMFDANITNKLDAVSVSKRTMQSATVTPVTPATPTTTVVTEASVSDKKADIERRKEEAKNNPVSEPVEYAKAVDEYKATELGSSEDAKNKKNKVVEEAQTKEGKAFVENQVAQLDYNDDGTITVYRSGTMQEGHNPATTSRKTAEIIANERKKQGLSSDIIEVKVDPSDISAVIPGIESEVFVKVDSTNKERIDSNTKKEQKSKTQLQAEKKNLNDELAKTKQALEKAKKDKENGTFKFSDSVYKDVVKKQEAKIKNLEWQLKKIDTELSALEAKPTEVETKRVATTQLRFAKVGDVLYDKEGNKYEILSKKDRYGRSLEYRKNDKELGEINPKTVSSYVNSFAMQTLYYEKPEVPVSDTKVIGVENLTDINDPETTRDILSSQGIDVDDLLGKISANPNDIDTDITNNLCD